ncbi:MAG: PilN domain-containing protein [Planctomycetales bacterium]|nr:PilN domain-containing protein [Planctomycetales bacterium]
MIGLTKPTERRTVAIEVGVNNLKLAVIRFSNGPPQVTVEQVTWRTDDDALTSRDTERQLANRISELVAKHALQKAEFYVGVASDFCVTRCVTGEANRVAMELDHLHERQALYLSLGPGQKLSAEAVMNVDAMHQHSLVAVVNSQTLGMLKRVADLAKINVVSLEPSAVGLCRLIGLIHDQRRVPVLVLKLDNRWAELCVAYEGRMYLNYRPSTLATTEQVVDAVRTHLVRLIRYCQKSNLLSEGALDRIYVIGPTTAAERVSSQLREDGTLQVEVFANRMARFFVTGDTPLHEEFASVVGTALTGNPQYEVATLSPNLVSQLDHFGVISWRAIAKKLFPSVAASMFFALFLQAVNRQAASHVTTLQKASQPVVQMQEQIQTLQVSRELAENKLKHVHHLINDISEPSWSDVTLWVTKCMPPAMYVDSLIIENNHELAIQGMSAAERDVFEFVSTLQKLPMVADVRIRSTSPSEQNGTMGVRFDLTCQIGKAAPSETHDEI